MAQEQVALFEGLDANGQVGLWVTNGTAAGTHELLGISGASTAGVEPSSLTVFDGEVLFNGLDASGQHGLWVTNGTAAGTHELTGIAGAYTSGRVIINSNERQFDTPAVRAEAAFRFRSGEIVELQPHIRMPP